MSTRYTIAGPDIGVRAVDFAGLVDELGDEAAMEALEPIKTGIHRVPGKEPIRLVRQHKQGDEGMGFDYFARRAGVDRDERDAVAESMEIAEPIAPPERNAPIEGESFGMNAQQLFTEVVKRKVGAPIMAAAVRFTVTLPLSIFIRAGSEDEAAEVVRRYVSGEEFEPGTGILMDPTRAFAAMLSVVQERRTLRDAGWKAELLRVEDLTPEEQAGMVSKLAAEELREFQANVRSNVDTLAAMLERVR